MSSIMSFANYNIAHPEHAAEWVTVVELTGKELSALSDLVVDGEQVSVLEYIRIIEAEDHGAQLVVQSANGHLSPEARDDNSAVPKAPKGKTHNHADYKYSIRSLRPPLSKVTSIDWVFELAYEGRLLAGRS